MCVCVLLFTWSTCSLVKGGLILPEMCSGPHSAGELCLELVLRWMRFPIWAVLDSLVWLLETLPYYSSYSQKLFSSHGVGLRVEVRGAGEVLDYVALQGTSDTRLGRMCVSRRWGSECVRRLMSSTSGEVTQRDGLLKQRTHAC